MRPPEDEALLRDMLAYARHAVAAVAGRRRSDLDSDLVLAAALERFIEVIGAPAGQGQTRLSLETSSYGQEHTARGSASTRCEPPPPR